MLESARLALHPLAVTDAEEMATVLADPGLYRYTGGAPLGVEELTRRYERQLAGPPGGDDIWLNWIIRRRDNGQAVGYVQATVHGSDADLAWVIGTAAQRQGFAAEAAARMCEWLRTRGIGAFTAQIHPEHAASQRIAAALGLAASDGYNDEGETIWR